MYADLAMITFAGRVVKKADTLEVTDVNAAKIELGGAGGAGDA
jgi:hypothetical protein